jgi:UDP-3-O-[3-hydroxymyristoyl] glucosamine N-acyltransferase
MARRFPREFTASQLVDRFGGALRSGDGERALRGLGSLAGAEPDELSFLVTPRHRPEAAATRAGAVLVADALASAVPASAACIVVDDPHVHFARVARWLVAESTPSVEALRHPSAVVDRAAVLGAGVGVGAHAVIEAGAAIGAGARIGANCFVGRDARIGEGTVLHPGVVVYHETRIGARCEIHSGTVIGSDGFGFARSRGRWEKVPQLGCVVIGDDVEIGSNCSIDRGALDDTVIGDGCKLDNLIQVAHNVRIGEHSVLAGCVGIAGSAVIGRRCMIGGGSGVLGHIEICDDAVVAGMTFVSRSIREPGFYTAAFPLMTNAAWEKTAATLKQLPSLRERLRRIERERGAPGPAPERT